MADTLSSDIRRAAIDLLARREHSCHELVAKLSRRFSDEHLIEKQVQRLADDGQQSDQRYLETVIRSRIRKGQGPIRIINELKQKGILDSAISQYFKEEGIDWVEVIKILSEVKYGKSLPKNDKEKAKRIRFFLYRGFNFEQIKQVLPS